MVSYQIHLWIITVMTLDITAKLGAGLATTDTAYAYAYALIIVKSTVTVQFSSPINYVLTY